MFRACSQVNISKVFIVERLLALWQVRTLHVYTDQILEFILPEMDSPAEPAL